MDILIHAHSLGNRSNIENIIHHRIEKKLAKNAAKYEMIHENNERIIVEIEKTYSPGIAIHKVKEKVFEILLKNIGFLKSANIGLESGFNKDLVIQLLSEWFDRNDSNGVIQKMKKAKDKNLEEEAWKG